MIKLIRGVGIEIGGKHWLFKTCTLRSYRMFHIIIFNYDQIFFIKRFGSKLKGYLRGLRLQ